MLNETNSKLFKSYQLDDKDKMMISAAWGHLSPHVNEFSDELHKHVMAFDHAKAFLKNDDALRYHKSKIEYWIGQVFLNSFNNDYYSYLAYINKLHKRIGLPPNYINSTFTFIRRFLRNRLNSAGASGYIDSVEKLIDINLELLSTHYAGEDFEELLSNIRLFRESLDSGYIEPFVQPIFSAETLKPSSYECLCRINHPEHGIIPPVRFMDIAKQIGMYHDITRIMFEKSLEFFKTRNKVFSINIAFSDISDPDTSHFIEDMIKIYKPAERLIIEIIETEELAEGGIIYDFCNKMRTHGVRIAIDDFGSGFSNFNHISKLSPDFIKIDGSLIKDLDVNFVNLAAVEGIISTATKLDICTVAEYIHSESIMNLCIKLGINKLQGYYLGCPVPLLKIAD